MENPSSYLRYRESPIPEPVFLAALARRTGCALLCDINNIHVTCANLGLDAAAYLDALPGAAVAESHPPSTFSSQRRGTRPSSWNERATPTCTPSRRGAARETVPLDLAALTFRFEPSLSLLRSPWPVDDIWHANQPNADPDATVDAGTGVVHLQIRRRGDDVRFRRLEPRAYSFRQAVLDGRDLAAAVAATNDESFDLAGALRALFEDGVLSGFRLVHEKEMP